MPNTFRLFFISFLFLLIQQSIFAQQLDDKPVRFVMVGLSHGHSHWIFQKQFQGDFELAGVYESDSQLVDQFKKTYRLKDDLFFSDLDRMLDEVQPEGALAFGPISEHLNVVRSCAPRGIHVMVEKPLAFDVSHAREMETLAKTHKIHLLTNYETSWYPTTDAILRFFSEPKDDLGPIRKAVFHHGHRGPKEIGVGPEFLTWLTDPDKNGAGALIDFGCYGANIMTALIKGERPVSIMALAQTHKPDIYPLVDDEASILIEYKDAQAIIQASWNWPFDRKDMEVYGANGYCIALDREKLKARFKGQATEELNLIYAKDTGTIANPFEYFVDVIRGDLKIGEYGLYSLENNLLVVEILSAAMESAKTGKRIYLTGKN
ncbi:Gfo/Idh/MocA family protein [Shivajiella indica]|uniref:Gfo/Idh/MocA family protein n=1 Tax=Shivajiella indica TaxID=872115 RepID=A0ABW5BBZ6_9BACT